MLNTGKNLDNIEYAKVNDIKDIRKKLSINNLSLPTTNFTGNSSGSFTSKIIAKGNSQKTSMDVKKDIPAIENSILKSRFYLIKIIKYNISLIDALKIFYFVIQKKLFIFIK